MANHDPIAASGKTFEPLATLMLKKFSPSVWMSRIMLTWAFFYACGMFSGTVSGLLAYAISFMNGAGGLAGWRWLMTMPPYTFVFVILLTLGWLIHTKRLNPWVAGLGLEAAQIVCYILLITIRNKEAKYIFVMIATAASQSFFPIIWPERIRAAHGTTTAGLAIGITNSMAQIFTQ
ncbi:putative Uncharacterized transporter [Glarea lozoyensis 74030]|uniref:Putative Uncharacterized transporter n=1 Tax=Glarea lozoyensis (strain ATCC 74030 / MF5533) TaxID=1104152 RepID=H0EGM6_GLAL7|nr:putative Uncharacterized transporter [Glarea lozoyensis 74030]